jgi:hypothetical protein
MKTVIISMLLLTLALSMNVPCYQYLASKLGTVSNCTIDRLDSQSIAWTVQINFNATFNWTNSSFHSVLVNLQDLNQKPIKAVASQCTTTPGLYSPGQSV